MRAAPKAPRMSHIGVILDKVLKKYGINEESMALFDIWEKELGPLAKKIKLAGKKGATLYVEIENPAYRQELKYRKKDIITKLNGHFGKKVIDDIKTK